MPPTTARLDGADGGPSDAATFEAVAAEGAIPGTQGRRPIGDLLCELGFSAPLPQMAGVLTIGAAFVAGFLAVGVGQAWIERTVGVPTPVVAVNVMVSWGLWTLWHSALFPRARRRYRRRLGERRGYRMAFVVHILPGTTWGFSHMLRPALNGPSWQAGTLWPRLPDGVTTEGVVVTVGWLTMASAIGLFVWAWRTLGTARVAFIEEFHRPSLFVPTLAGPYGLLRHPLFWAGLLGSVGVALVVQTGTAAAVVAVNLTYGLVYNRLEDRRLVSIFGRSYGDYIAEVAAVVPRRAASEIVGRRPPGDQPLDGPNRHR